MQPIDRSQVLDLAVETYEKALGMERPVPFQDVVAGLLEPVPGDATFLVRALVNVAGLERDLGHPDRLRQVADRPLARPATPGGGPPRRGAAAPDAVR